MKLSNLVLLAFSLSALTFTPAAMAQSTPAPTPDVSAESLPAVSGSTEALGQPDVRARRRVMGIAAPAVAPEALKMVDDFFSKLEAGRVDAAYDEILAGTKIVETPKDVVLLKTKTREAIKMFGDIMGHDVVSKRFVGTRLLRVTCVSLGKQFPIRWRLYFYKAGDTWKLIDIRIDDRLLDMFGEPDTASAPAAAAQ